MKKKIGINPRAYKIAAQRWQYFVPPFKPSKKDCQIYAGFVSRTLKNKKSPRILLLGVTPELREVLTRESFSRGAKIYCLDINPIMARAMTELLTIKNPKEKIIIGDWLNTPFKNKFFDAVLGDIVVENIPRDKQVELLKEISRILKPNGYFISRFTLVFRLVKKYSSDEIKKHLKKISQLYLNGQINFKELLSYFEIPIWINSYYHYRGNCSLSYYKKDFFKLRRKSKNLLYKLILDKFLDWYSHGFKSVWSLFERKNLIKFLTLYFRIIDFKYADDYMYANNFPIYLLKKK